MIAACLVASLGVLGFLSIITAQTLEITDPSMLLARDALLPTRVETRLGEVSWELELGRSISRMDGGYQRWCTASVIDCPVDESVDILDSALSAWWQFRTQRPYDDARRVDLVESLSEAADEERLWCMLGNGGPRQFCQLWTWTARYGQVIVTLSLTYFTPDLGGASLDTFSAVVRAVDVRISDAIQGAEP